MALERVDKLVAVAQNISRADARKLIAKGALCVNGTLTKSISAKADGERDELRLLGKLIYYNKELYILQNKPLGIVSSTDDHDGKTVLDILPPQLCRKGLFPAGRLDKYSEGMLILTTDGRFAHEMLSPKRHVPKVYYVELDAPILNQRLAELFAQGVFLGDGEYSSPAKLEIVTPTSGYVTIHEGIYHQVRRMFDQNGGKVTRLVRVQIGGLRRDETLRPGESRLLTAAERRRILEG